MIFCIGFEHDFLLFFIIFIVIALPTFTTATIVAFSLVLKAIVKRKRFCF